MSKSNNSHPISIVFVLTLAGIFAASILMVLMLGVGVYGNLQKTAEMQFNDRISFSYVATKIRAHDSANAIRVGEFAGASALFLDDDFYDEEFTTIIYTYDGWLKEIFTDKESTLDEDSWLLGSAGMPLLEVSYLSFEMKTPALLVITYLDGNGDKQQMFLNLRSEVDGDI
jgi:hypothetical protein